jgi:hypothetical protein
MMATTWSLAFLLMVLATIFQSCVFRKTDLPAPCTERLHLEVVSLSIYPDPLPDARPIDEWRLRVRSDTPAECQAFIRVVEVEREIVAAEAAAFLILGVNEVKLRPSQNYQFTGNERCFNVVAQLKEGKIQIEGRQTFCALHIDNRWWTLR